MKHFSIVFPGQGSQQIGMALEFSDRFPIVKDTFSEASEALGYDIFDLVKNGPEEKLNQTEFTQPALLTAETAIYRCFQEFSQHAKPSIMAGHSLGEYTALVCADAIDFSDAVRVVRDRGQFMQTAVPAGEGGMAAIIGLSPEVVAQLCKEISEEKHSIVSPANFNSTGQIVVAGKYAAVEAAVVAAKSKGAKLAKMLPVSVPSHCALMQPAAEKLLDSLEKIAIRSPKIPVIHNVNVQTETNPEKIRLLLVEQLTSPVRWVETMQQILAKQITLILECGPGKVLAGLIQRIDPAFTVVSMNSIANLELAIKHTTG